MSRLKKHVTAGNSVYPGENSSALVVTAPDSQYSRDYYGKAYRTAQQLISGLQLVQTNERTIEVARDIMAGFYDDISSLDDSATCWEAWMGRTRDIFAAKGVAIPGEQVHDPKFKNEYTHIYRTALQLIQQLPMTENNYRTVEIARAIKTGAYADISDVTECGTHWAAWLHRTKELLRKNGTLLAQPTPIKRLIRS